MSATCTAGHRVVRTVGTSEMYESMGCVILSWAVGDDAAGLSGATGAAGCRDGKAGGRQARHEGPAAANAGEDRSCTYDLHACRAGHVLQAVYVPLTSLAAPPCSVT
jgi:hypothetical protein